MNNLGFLHVTDDGAEAITEDKARILIESRYQPSVHQVMMNDLMNGSRISVRMGYLEFADQSTCAAGQAKL